MSVHVTTSEPDRVGCRCGRPLLATGVRESNGPPALERFDVWFSRVTALDRRAA